VDSNNLRLDYVDQENLVDIAPIYKGDGYRSGGSLNPHSADDTVDCSGYVTQLLRRLARLQDHADPQHPPTYPILHMGAGCWRSWGSGPPNYCNQLDPEHVAHQPVVRVQTIQLEDLAPGDIIAWRTVRHVGVFGWWREFEPSKGRFKAMVWEARGAGVNVYRRDLRSQSHLARHWVDGVVYNSCP